MDDPVYTIPFLKEVIENRKKDIIGIAVAKGDRLKLFNKMSKVSYIFSLLMIMGVTFFLYNSFKTVSFKIRKKLSGYFKFIESPSILKFAEDLGIKTYNIKSPNNKTFLEELRRLELDVIINQSQFIIKKELLNIPKIGVINRHNALLPKNRGRLTPFWVLFKKEKETGVSIHFLDEGIDSGDIIVQEKYPIIKKDNFKSIVKKNYEIAPKAMQKALYILEKGNYNLIKNDSNLATYNHVPTLKQAIKYRIRRFGLAEYQKHYKVF